MNTHSIYLGGGQVGGGGVGGEWDKKNNFLDTLYLELYSYYQIRGGRGIVKEE